MKTLLLTSAGMDVKEEILKILPKPVNQIKIAHIITASKIEKNTSYLEKERQIMKKIGLKVKEIDIEGKNENQLRKILSNKDIIYVQGGNAFYLLKHARISGFDEVVKELINRGVIYIGVSAGSYIACPTIEMATWKHQDRNRAGLKNLTALNLVPFLVTVHYEPKYRDILKKEIAKSKYPVKILTDDQALLIKNNSVQTVGKGDEVKI